MQGRLGEKELIIGKQNTVVKNYAILVPLVSFLYCFCKVMNDYVSTKKKRIDGASTVGSARRIYIYHLAALTLKLRTLF